MTATAEYEKAKQTPPKAGDTVRVTIEGPAVGDWPDMDIRAGERIRIVPEDKVTVEVIARVRPDFLDGDAIKATDYPKVAVRQGARWRWTDEPAQYGWPDDITVGNLTDGIYTPLRIGGKSSAAQS